MVVIFIKDYKELFKGDLKSSDREQKDLVHNVIKNVAEEFASKQHNVGYVVNIYDTPILLISFAEENIHAASEQTQKLVGEFEGVMYEQFKIDLTAVAGTICRGIYNIAAAYNEAISFYGDHAMAESAHTDDYLPGNEAIQQIKGAIENGNAVFAKNTVGEIFDRACEQYQNDLVFLKMLVTDLLHVIIETGQECGRSVNKTAILSAVSRAENTDDILKQMQDMIDSICPVSLTNKNKLTIYEIKKFVEKNLSNPELSVYYTAQMLEASEKVLSKIVKTEYNVGLLEYINRCRIQKAKIYLETTGQTIAEISKAVGYLNVKTFIRVFKQYSNTTPTQYRRMKGK